MSVLFYGLTLAVLAFLLHLIIWRIHIPKKQTSALLKIFLFVLILGMFFIIKFPELIRWNILPKKNFFEVAQFLLLFVTLAVAYIVSYPAIEVDSPTLLIIKAIFDAGKRGLDKSELEKLMNNDLLVIPRIRDMLSDNMAYLDGNKYKLTLKGTIMAQIFLFYRGLIKVTIGG